MFHDHIWVQWPQKIHSAFWLHSCFTQQRPKAQPSQSLDYQTQVSHQWFKNPHITHHLNSPAEALYKMLCPEQWILGTILCESKENSVTTMNLSSEKKGKLKGHEILLWWVVICWKGWSGSRSQNRGLGTSEKIVSKSPGLILDTCVLCEYYTRSGFSEGSDFAKLI